METRGRTQDGKGDGNGDGNECSSNDGDGIEDGIGEGVGEGKKRKKPHKSYIRDVGNRRDLGVKRKKHRQKRVDSVAANPDNLDNSKEAGREAQCRIPGTDCAVMCNLINTHTPSTHTTYNTHTHTHTHHLPLGVSRNPATKDNRCSCSSSLPGGL